MAGYYNNYGYYDSYGDWVKYEEEKPKEPECKHEAVDFGFRSTLIWCKHCGVDLAMDANGVWRKKETKE